MRMIAAVQMVFYTHTNVTGYRYISHLNCLAIQAGFYGDVVVFASQVEGREFDPQPGQVRRYFSSPVTFAAQWCN